ncbi:carboxymuconolactone decarboxylase family protein [uncultured Apibacter sp.]|uniref:carboxymuconolactone decarboxylase family protein n=1 Tax=uncultured Apibacter sp. TaxID=1778616 RepID=UPI0025D87C36|nr:carboxymuconolactone decarboxylase family protein [uncultured Apibacter sp.]
MNRIEICKDNFKKLFKGEALNGKGNDPEMMDILQKFIFGEVFTIGDIDKKTRELITCVVLTSLQQLPQLKSHVNAALIIGVTPIEIREAVYQCVPVIGFPKTLNALRVINEVFTECNIQLPLERQGMVMEDNRYDEGLKIQDPLYGNRIENLMSKVPGGIGEKVAQFLTEVYFGDFYTRKGLNLPLRELLNYCVLTSIGAEDQLVSHYYANIKIGNSKELLAAAIVQTLPYIGFPLALKGLKIIIDCSEKTLES